MDLEHRIVPNVIVLPATAIALPAQTLLHLSPEYALAALGAALFLFLAVLAYPAGMGMGDVKLALFMGAVLGKTVGVALMIGMLAALILGSTCSPATDPGTQDGDPVCAVPGARVGDRVVLGRCAPERVSRRSRA